MQCRGTDMQCGGTQTSSGSRSGEGRAVQGVLRGALGTTLAQHPLQGTPLPRRCCGRRRVCVPTPPGARNARQKSYLPRHSPEVRRKSYLHRYQSRYDWVSMTFGELLETAWVSMTFGELLLHYAGSERRPGDGSSGAGHPETGARGAVSTRGWRIRVGHAMLWSGVEVISPPPGRWAGVEWTLNDPNPGGVTGQMPIRSSYAFARNGRGRVPHDTV